MSELCHQAGRLYIHHYSCTSGSNIMKQKRIEKYKRKEKENKSRAYFGYSFSLIVSHKIKIQFKLKMEKNINYCQTYNNS